MSQQQRRRRDSSSARSSSSGSESSATPARSNSQGNEPPSWWQRAGSWVADKYEDVSSAVGETIDNVTRTVGDAWDVLSSSDLDVDWRNRKVAVSTDMDEVLDLMPADIRAAISLDRQAEGANEVRMELDYKSDTVTITSKDVRILGVNTPTMSTAGASLRDVRITLKGEGGLPIMGGAKSTGVDIQIGSATADKITANTKDGPVSASRLTLGRTQLSVTGEGKGLPTGQDGAANFFVSSAVIDGLQTSEGSASQVSVQGLNGAVDQQAGTGFVEARTLSASGASAKGNHIGETSLTGARVDMARGKNGTEHTVSVAQANVGDLQTAGGDHLAGANVSGLSGSFGNGNLELAAQVLGVRELSGKNQLTEGSMTDLSVSASGLGGESWNTHVGAKGASLKGLQAGDLRLDNLSATDLAATANKDKDGLSADGTLGALTGKGLHHNDLDMGAMWARDMNFALDNGVVDAGARRLDVAGLKAKDVSVGSVGVDYFQTQQRGKKDATFQAGRTRAKDIAADGTTVGSLDARNTHVNTRDGAYDARIRTLEAGDIASGDHRVGGASLSGLSASGSRDAMTLGLDQGSVTEASTMVGGSALTVEQAGVSGVAVDRRGSAVSGSVNSAQLTRAAYDGSTVGHVGVTGVSGSHSADRSRVGVQGLSVDELSSKGSSVGSIRAAQINAERDASGLSGSVSSVEAAQIKAGDATVDRASVTGVSGSHNAERSALDVGGISATGLAKGDSGAEAVWASQLHAERDASGVSGTLGRANASHVYTPGLTVADVAATGMSGSKSGDNTTLGLNALDATTLSHRGATSSADVGSVGVRDAGVSLGPDGMAARAAQLSASDISGSATASKGGGGGMDPALIRSLGGLVTDADIRASVPLHAGKYAAGNTKLGVKDGTQLDANVSIRDGSLVPGATRADFSRNLNGPLWVGIRGGYLDTDGSLRANLAGAPNINLGKSLGLGKTMDTRVSSLADMQGVGGGDKGPSRSGRPDIATAFDQDNLSVNADVALGNGRLDMGNGNGATLHKERETDNAVHIEGGGQQDLVMTFARFLTSSLRMGVGDASLSAGTSSVEQGKVSLDPKAQEGTAINGTVGNITLRDVRAGK